MKVTKKEIVRNRKIWLDALRSGKYKRTTGKLHKIIDGQDSFCCLGVACDVISKEYPNSLKIQKLEHSGIVVYDNDSNSLPYTVRPKLGLSETNGNILFHKDNPVLKNSKKGVATKSAVAANDSNYFSFKKIADALEWEFNNTFKV